MSPTSTRLSPGASRLPPVLIATVVTLFLAYLARQGCFALGLGDSFYCHSDFGGIYLGRELAGGRFPYSPPPLEYPAGLGLVIWLASAVTSSALGFVRVNMVILAVACLATAWMLWHLRGRDAMLFAAAPSLALYAFLNWDMLAVVFSVAAVSAFVCRRDVPAGLLLGIGAAIKVFPGLLLLPMAAERWREGDRGAAWRLLVAAAVSLVLVNAPVAWASFDGWAHFVRFNSTRVVDWGTLWSAGCQTFGPGLCENIRENTAASQCGLRSVLKTTCERHRWATRCHNGRRQDCGACPHHEMEGNKGAPYAPTQTAPRIARSAGTTETDPRSPATRRVRAVARTAVPC